MRVTVAAVGRARGGVFRDLYDRYAGRSAWDIALREVEARGTDARSRRRAEGERLLAAIPKGARVVALDEAGEMLSSREFAAWIGRARDAGTRDLCVLVGGPDGLDEAAKVRADLVLSLGRATWPHLLARGLAVEQLYRAQGILAGHPYHRE